MKNAMPDFSLLAERWPSPFVARERLSEFSGGMLNPKTEANRDSRGDGIRGRFKVGRKVAYPVTEVIKALQERAGVV